MKNLRVEWGNLIAVLCILLAIVFFGGCGDAERTDDECKTETSAYQTDTRESTRLPDESGLGQPPDAGTAGNSEDSNVQHVREAGPDKGCPDANPTPRTESDVYPTVFDAGTIIDTNDAYIPLGGMAMGGNHGGANGGSMAGSMGTGQGGQGGQGGQTELEPCWAYGEVGRDACLSPEGVCNVNVPCDSPSLYLFTCVNCEGE